ncbi:MAG: hypothetical protein J0M03_03820 [Acidobacteria bacterium]|nr:hypothetical protein [Acidobacteriota bacterium]
MSQPISISLAGNGQVLVLTSQTARQAFYQFFYCLNKNIYDFSKPQTSKLRRWELKPLESYKWHKDNNFTILDFLMRRHLKNYYGKEPKHLFDKLNDQETKFIEKFINHYLLNKGYSLVQGEGLIQKDLIQVDGKSYKEKVIYIIRYGVVFILEYLPKDIALSVPERFLVLETSDDFQQVYYDSIFTNQVTKRLEVKLHNFWKRTEVFSIPLADFKPHKIFAVKDILPYKGFKLID